MRRPALAAALLLLGLSSCTDSSDDASSPRTTSTPHASGNASSKTEGLPAPPAGSRWLGIGGAMIAVPDSWKITSQICAGKGPGAAVVKRAPPVARACYYAVPCTRRDHLR